LATHWGCHQTIGFKIKEAQMTHEFKNAMRSHNINCVAEIIADGKVHRFANDGKGNKDCWYILFQNNDGSFGGSYGNWQTGDKHAWSSDNKPLSKEIYAQIERARNLHAQEEAERHDQAALKAAKQWSNVQQAAHSPYLQKKQINAHGVAFAQNGDILVPLRDIDGKLWSLQFIHPDGTKRFLSGGKKKGCFHTLGDLVSAEAIYLCEGYATGASVYEATGITTVVSFDAGNIEPVITEIKKKYPALRITIAADNDQWKERNVGKETATTVANKHGCKVALPAFPEVRSERKPTDFNDLHVLMGLDEVKRQLQSASQQKPSARLPDGYSLKKDGLYYDGDWLCSNIEVLAHTRDENGKYWGRLVRFEDPDGRTHQLTISMDLFSRDCSEVFAHLLSSGLRMTSKRALRNKIADYLQNASVDKRALCTPRIGWHGDCFILPDGTIPETDETYLQSDNNNFAGFQTSGSLEEWHDNVALPCRGNSRLVFALSCAFAAPLLPIINKESGGFNLKGASSIGKSTAIAVAASVWGNHQFIQQWRTTGNALEAVAESRNHALLLLDELGQVDGKEAGEIAYMLANGTGKNRLKSKGGLRKKFEWNLLFLSTGEISLVDKINEAGKRAHAGMRTRMVDIPADAGKGYKLFDTLNGFENGSKLADHLKTATNKYCGAPIRAFLPHIPAIKKELLDEFKQIESDFFDRFVDKNADGQVKRVASRFALVATAGELAIKLRILPFNLLNAFEATGVCFINWLEDRDSSGSYEEEEGIKQVLTFIEINHSSRFANLRSDEGNPAQTEKIINQAGYKQEVGGQYHFYIFPGVFDKEVCKGYDPTLIKKELKSRGMLLCDNDGRYTKTIRIPLLGKSKKLIVLAPSTNMEAEQ
jgi:putative DNA primase/helicase